MPYATTTLAARLHAPASRQDRSEGPLLAQRTVRFYEILNKNKERFPNKIPFDDLLREVDDLQDDEAYVATKSMEILGSSFVPSTAGSKAAVSLITLDRITRDVRLRIERRRNYRPLVLDQDETLAEPTFFSIFDNNVLAVARNSGSAPGATSFREYVTKLNLIDGGVELAPLVDRDALRALREVETLTKFQFAVGPDVAAEIFGETNMITGMIRHMRQKLGNVGIELAIRIAPKGQQEESEIAFRDIEALATSNAIGFVDKAEIWYRRIEDGRAASFDLLQEAVTQSFNVELDSESNQPTVLSVAQGIAEAYDELYDEIRSALAATS
jgi:hypothetical protein